MERVILDQTVAALIGLANYTRVVTSAVST